MSRELTYLITEENIGTSPLTIHGFLKGRGYSHAVLVSLKKTPEGILKNGVWARVHDTLSPGDRLLVRLAEEKTSDHIVPRPLPFPVIYEDEDLLIVNKPANMPIHPSQGNYENTLANAAAWYFCQKGESFVYRCINRLDADTSGLIIVAKNMLSAALLGKAMQQRMIRREYLAVVCGTLTGSGTVHAPIARVKPGDVRRQVDFLCGDDAITHYKSLLCHAPYSLLSLHLETGRTHQIRVHMSALGYPLAGDQLYYPAFSDTKIKRQALHSHRLSFSHPVTGEMLTFTSPLPCDMAALIDPEPSAHRGSSLPAVLRG